MDVLVELPFGPIDAGDMQQAVTAIAESEPFELHAYEEYRSDRPEDNRASMGIDIGIGVGAAALYEGLKYLILKLRDLHEAADRRDYSDEELIEHGTRLLAIKLDLRVDDLKPTNFERLEPDAANIGYEDNNGLEYEITIAMFKGVATIQITHCEPWLIDCKDFVNFYGHAQGS